MTLGGRDRGWDGFAPFGSCGAMWSLWVAGPLPPVGVRPRWGRSCETWEQSEVISPGGACLEGVEGVFDVVLVVMGMAGGLLACLAILGAAQVNAIKWLWVTIFNSVWITSLSKLPFGYYKRWPKTWFEVVGLFANLETFPLIHSAFILSKSYETKFLIILKLGIWNSSPEFVCRLPKGQLGGKEKVKISKSMKRISEFSQQMNSQSTKEDIAFVCFVQKPFESSRTFSVCRLTLSRLHGLGFLSCLVFYHLFCRRQTKGEA